VGKFARFYFSVGSFFFVSYWVARVSVIFGVLIGWSEAIFLYFKPGVRLSSWENGCSEFGLPPNDFMHLAQTLIPQRRVVSA
jgi:hypothetical protein